MKRPQRLRKIGLVRLVSRVYLLGGAGKILIKEEQIQMPDQKQGNLKLLNATEKLCSESESSCNRKGMDRGQSLKTQALTGISRPKPNLRKDNLSSEKCKEHLASSSRRITSYVTLGKLRGLSLSSIEWKGQIRSFIFEPFPFTKSSSLKLKVSAYIDHLT